MSSHNSMLNWLRASVLGANDGIVSVASIVVGVAGATSDNYTIMLSGLAGTLAGALSMAAGEYVSVSSQRDAEHAMRTKADIAHPDELTNPWHAAIASALSFFAGAALPLLIVYLTPSVYKVPATFIAVIIALSVTGILSAHVGGANKKRATIRLIIGGLIAMSITYIVGAIFGVSGI